MKKVLMALIVVGFMAVPLFADIDVNSVAITAPSGFTTLVYQVSGSMKGWEFKNAGATIGEEDDVKVNAYVVVDVNSLTLQTAPQVDTSDVNDPNFLNNTTMIVLGSTANIKKAYAIVRNDQFDQDEDNNSVVLDLATVDQPIFASTDKSKEFVVDASFSASGDLFDLFAATSMFSKLSNVTLSKTVKLNLPKSLKACGEFETFDATSGFEEDDLTGNLSVVLNTSYTKNVFTFSVFKAQSFVQADLISKGYQLVPIGDMINAQ
jgi:hypothetical protein